MAATNIAAQGFRSRRFALAVTSSLFSKGAAFVTQVLAIPIAINYCGLGTYTLYLGLVAASLAPVVLILRLGPRIVGQVSRLHFANDRTELTALFQASIKVSVASCAAAAIAATTLLAFPEVRGLFSELASEDVAGALGVLCLINIVGAILFNIESIQSGLHETHHISTRAAIANVLSCICLVLFIPRFPSLFMLIVILHLLPLSTRLINSGLFLWRHRELLFARLNKGRTAIRDLLQHSLRHTFVAGFCAYCGLQAPLLILATQSANVSVGRASALSLQIVLQLLSLIGVLLTPSIPAIANASAAGDFRSVQRYRKNLAIAILASGGLMAIAGLVGGFMMADKLGLTGQQAAVLFGSAGVFFAVCAAEQYLYTLLLTLCPNENLSLHWIIGAKSLAVLLAAIVFVFTGFEIVSLICLSIIISVTSLLPLYILGQRAFRQLPAMGPERLR